MCSGVEVCVSVCVGVEGLVVGWWFLGFFVVCFGVCAVCWFFCVVLGVRLFF